MEAIHASVDGLKDSPVYDHILLLQSLRGVGFMSAVVLVAEMGSFDLFPSPKKLYAYFGLDPAVKQSGKFNGDKVPARITIAAEFIQKQTTNFSI